jgi:hypothetical protein
MKKQIFISTYLVLILLLFSACEEYYTPVLDEKPKVMVVDSHITNDLQYNFVRVSKTRNFYSTAAIEWVSGATVELVEDNFKIVKAREDAPGYYVFPSTPGFGRKYKLRITNSKDIYESDYEIMPPAPTIDSLYTQHKIEKAYRTNGYGVPELFESPGRQISIDAPITPELKYYRFNYRAIIQWKYTPKGPWDSTLVYTPVDTLKRATNAASGPPPTKIDTSAHITYGWISKTNTGLFNLAGPKEFSSSDKVMNHPIVLLKYDNSQYLDSVQQIPFNWIIILEQYGITKESFDFHENLNRQFSADGTLFDPVISQVYGNIKCISDPSKIVMGFFDLNSYKQYRYYLNLGSGNDNTVKLRRINHFYDIPDRGYKYNTPPIFWENNYD